MKKRILDYRRRIESILAQGGERDWQALREEHLVQISFFQHERMVHLIVTALFALMELIAILLLALAFSPGALALCAALLVLLVPYILHYFLLENEVQKLYALYDRIRAYCEKAGVV